MPPTPKRRQSTRRTGKRRASKKLALPTIVYDKNTGKPRLSHRNRPEVTSSETTSNTSTQTDK